MTDLFKALAKQPSWVLLLIVGALIAALPSVSFDKEHYFTTHHPNTLLPVFIGCTLILIGMVGFGISLWQSERKDASGVDLTKVSERNGFLSTMVTCANLLFLRSRQKLGGGFADTQLTSNRKVSNQASLTPYYSII